MCDFFSPFVRQLKQKACTHSIIFCQPFLRWTPRLESFNLQSPLAFCTLPDRAARDSVSRAFKSEQSHARDGTRLGARIQKLLPSEEIKPIEGSFHCLFHFNFNMSSVQMVNLPKGASSNGDIRAWIIYCAQPTTATSVRIWQPKECRARPSRLQQQARVCLFDRRVNNMLLIRLFTQQWERMPLYSLPLCMCVFVHANQSIFRKMWVELRDWDFSFFSLSLSFCPLQEMPQTFPNVRFVPRQKDLWLKIQQNDKCNN